MTDSIGRAALEFEVNDNGASAAMAKLGTTAEQLENKIEGLAQGVKGTAEPIQQLSGATGQLDATTKRFLTNLEREAITFGRTRSEALELLAAKRGVAQQAAPFIAQIKAQEEAQKAAAAAAKAEAAAQREAEAAKRGSIKTLNEYGLSQKQVNAALRKWMRGHGPLVFLSSPVPVKGGSPALSAALAAAEAAPLTAAASETGIAWPYTTFGTPGQVVERKTVSDLDTTFVRFANGVRLTIKPTKFAAGQVSLIARIGDGRLGLPPDRDIPAWASGDVFLSGGLKALNIDQVSRALAGRAYALEANFDDEGFMITARTRSEVLATQLQLLTAHSARQRCAGRLHRQRPHRDRHRPLLHQSK